MNAFARLAGGKHHIFRGKGQAVFNLDLNALGIGGG